MFFLVLFFVFLQYSLPLKKWIQSDVLRLGQLSLEPGRVDGILHLVCSTFFQVFEPDYQ